jgi:hypothetical protein
VQNLLSILVPVYKIMFLDWIAVDRLRGVSVHPRPSLTH